MKWAKLFSVIEVFEDRVYFIPVDVESEDRRFAEEQPHLESLIAEAERKAALLGYSQHLVQ